MGNKLYEVAKQMGKYPTIERIVSSLDKVACIRNELACTKCGDNVLSNLEEYLSEIQRHNIKGANKEIKDMLNLVIRKNISQFWDRVKEVEILYKLVREKKIEVEEWHPPVSGKTRKPEFRLRINNLPVFLEVKTIRETAIEQQKEEISMRICKNFQQEVQQVLKESNYKSNYAVEILLGIDLMRLSNDDEMEDMTVKEAAKKVASLLQDKGNMDKLINQTKRYRDLTEAPPKKIHQSGNGKALENLLKGYGKCPSIEFTLDEVSEELGSIEVMIASKKSPGIYCDCCSVSPSSPKRKDQQKVWNEIAKKVGQLPEKEISILLFWFESYLYSQNSIEGERLQVLVGEDGRVVKYRRYSKLKEEIFENFSNLDGIIAWAHGSWEYHISPMKRCLPSVRQILGILTGALNSEKKVE